MLSKENSKSLFALFSSSSFILDHPPQLKASMMSPTSPQGTPCRNCVKSPHPKLQFLNLPPKTPKNPQINLYNQFTSLISVLPCWSSHPIEDLPRLTGESLFLPRRASYEAKWFDVALRFTFLSLR